MATVAYDKVTIRVIRCTLLLTLSFLQIACVVQPPVTPGDPSYAPVLPQMPMPEEVNDGAIYRSDLAVSLFTDRKARRVGDVITIVLSERTSSTKSSKVGVDKDSNVSIAGDSASTNNSTLLGTNPSFKNFNLPTDLTGSRTFEGEADADQSNSLSGRISVTVAQVLPNGNLVVRGEKWMTLNRGDEYIRVSGIVRPDDISDENTLRSTQLANARITYSGTGEFADSQQMGWLSRFFNSPIWPF